MRRICLALAPLALVAAASGVLHAQYTPESIDVEVGKSVARDVGGAIGYQCDDPSLISATLRTVELEGRPPTNVFTVTGVRPGATRCRVGLDYSRPSVLFDVRVR
ncbi:MAG: hypothetical protein KF773_18130 [Deltaproteobacteria bacterium]|nr:hypothetical protein [Deltaproteobacteria bacterium]MCW5804202.1 hypothetical protein [Deltaproteobacteria bacterium]